MGKFLSDFQLTLLLCAMANILSLFCLTSYFNKTVSDLLIERRNLNSILRKVESNYLTVSQSINEFEIQIEFQKKVFDIDSTKSTTTIQNNLKRISERIGDQYFLYLSTSEPIDTLEFVDNNGCQNKVIVKIPTIGIAIPKDGLVESGILLNDNYIFPYFSSISCDSIITYHQGTYSGQFSFQDPGVVGFKFYFYSSSPDYKDLEFKITGGGYDIDGNIRGYISWIYNPEDLAAGVPPRPPFDPGIPPLKRTPVYFLKSGS